MSIQNRIPGIQQKPGSVRGINTNNTAIKSHTHPSFTKLPPVNRVLNRESLFKGFVSLSKLSSEKINTIISFLGKFFLASSVIALMSSHEPKESRNKAVAKQCTAAAFIYSCKYLIIDNIPKLLKMFDKGDYFNPKKVAKEREVIKKFGRLAKKEGEKLAKKRLNILNDRVSTALFFIALIPVITAVNKVFPIVADKMSQRTGKSSQKQTAKKQAGKV